MKRQAVVIKSNRYGITLFLDEELPFQELLKEIQEKFRASADFFKDAQMALAFEGRPLSREEQMEIISVIQENTSLEIPCVLEKDALKESYMRQALEMKQPGVDGSDGKFYKGTLRSGQVLESETSIIILGDVNPGATVVSKGNVVVLGALKGTVHAGATGNLQTFVAALRMDPMQIRIADYIARGADGNDTHKKKKAFVPMIAYVEEGNIYLEPINKTVLRDIQI